MNANSLSLDKARSEEANRISFRICLAEDLGAAALGVDNPYESDATLIDFKLRLSREQPDLSKQLDILYGRLFALVVDRSPSAIGVD